jgi:hypothetical protein
VRRPEVSERVEQAGHRHPVYFEERVAPGVDTRSFSNLSEASDTTDTDTFGPAGAAAPATDEDWVAFGCTEDNAVVREDTNP